MQELVLDFHLHSKYSRAVSSRMNLENMYLWARKKGINILTVSDFTHPLWFQEARKSLGEVQEGVYKLKNKVYIEDKDPETFKNEFLGPYFILSAEVSSIYSENGIGHRIHNLIFSPSFETAEKINKEFKNHNFNLLSDGRPTFGMTSKNLAEMLFSLDPKIAIIPCHVWTPWFSLYGSRSGYNTIVDCFGNFAKYIFAVETGLSSDPAMNWRIKELSSRSIVSFSDAHSLEKMGREATVLKLRKGTKIKKEDITYSNILNAFVRGRERIFEIGYTIEFYPEEGKYHYTGHRNCGVSYSPSNTPKGAICIVCHRPLTVGVMRRVEELAGVGENNFTYEKDSNGVVWVKDPQQRRPPFVSVVPLLEILSETLKSGVSSQAVVNMYNQLVSSFDSEHTVLFRTSLEEIRSVAGGNIATGIEKVRGRNIVILPGFDGEYGKVQIWNENDQEESAGKNQLGLGF